MEPIFLVTKLGIPPSSPHAVRRARLIDALERGIPKYKLTLISAPAGYGKTTLVAQWAASSDFPVAWFSLGQEDNHIDRFLRCLLRAWEKVQPGVMQSQLGLLLGATSPDTEAVLSAFISVANEVPEHTALVFDDYHLIEDPSIHQALISLLDHLPPTLHFVLAGRAEPPLPLARYRVHHELLEFRAEDLQFLQEETTDFLNGLMKLDLSDDEVNHLQAQLEGWIAGLQLVALSRQRRLAGADKLVVSGRHRFIADFLSEDVLAPLAADLRQFLLQTSILDRLCGPLCDAVTGRENGQAVLEIVDRANLFLMPLDDSRQWFRYHRLFADFLNETLKRRHPHEVGELHCRAARWYLAQDLPEQAFHHALAGSDAALVVQIFDRYCNAKLNGGEVSVVGKWVNALPKEWYAAYPMIGLARVGFLAFTGAFEASIHALDEVEQQLTPAKDDTLRWQLARVTAVRCYFACLRNDLAQAETYADRALQELSEEDLNWRPGVYVALGDAYRLNARWQEAKECYMKALAVTDAPRLRFLSMHVYGALADLALRQGQLRDADAYWSKALAVIEEPENWGRLEFPVVGWVYVRMGELFYERNELAAAEGHLLRGLEHAELGGDVRALIAGYLIAGRVKLTEGNIMAAVDYLERARPLVEKSAFPDWTSRFERFQIELWLVQDRLKDAVEWVDEKLQSDDFHTRPEGGGTQLAIARVLTVRGDASSIHRALGLLTQLLAEAEAEGRKSVQVEALIIQALAEERRGERAAAMSALERALRIAEPDAYMRLFADLALPMGRLLQAARSRGVMSNYVTKLLAIIGDDLSSAVPSLAALPEPLSRREQEILELVAAGLTNQEIADRLVISAETVKKHVGNIFGKLGVSSRTEAVARARALDLLV